MADRVGTDLKDPKLFRDNAFWQVFAWLRRNDPVHWHPEPDGSGFWAITRHRDVMSVYTDHETFSSRYGMRLDSNPAAVSAVTGRMLIVSDPPDHTQVKSVISKAFGHAELPKIERVVDQVISDQVAEAAGAGEMDFVDVAARIPNYVVCALMGLPRADWEWIGKVTTLAFEGEDEETRTGAHGEIFLYFSDLLAERRKQPGDDFVSTIANGRRKTAEPGVERPLSDEEIIFNCNGVLAGANETTRYSASGGLLAFIQNPEQWQTVVNGDDEVISRAVEEVLRWTTPGMHAMRTATRPAEIGGVPIKTGDRVTLWNGSANRDEDVYDHADQFDVTRWPNKHFTFGGGRHLCIGARLARRELAVFLTELVSRVDHAELIGEPEFTSSNFTWGLRKLPVRLVPRRT